MATRDGGRSSRSSQVAERGRRDPARHQDLRHRVRPRLVWTGLGLMLLGATVAGTGVALLGSSALAWWLLVGGSVIGLGGCAVALRAGLLYDITSAEGPGRVVDEVRADVVRPGPDPEDRTAPPHVAEHAAGTQQLAEAVQAQSSPRPQDRSLRKLGGWCSVAAGIVLLCTQGALSDASRGASWRVAGLGIVLVLTGLVLSNLVSRVAAVVAIAAGALVLVMGLVGDESTLAVALQLLAAGLAIAGGLGGLSRGDVRRGHP
jgi:hypothetical protein